MHDFCYILLRTFKGVRARADLHYCIHPLPSQKSEGGGGEGHQNSLPFNHSTNLLPVYSHSSDVPT